MTGELLRNICIVFNVRFALLCSLKCCLVELQFTRVVLFGFVLPNNFLRAAKHVRWVHLTQNACVPMCRQTLYMFVVTGPSWSATLYPITIRLLYDNYTDQYSFLVINSLCPTPRKQQNNIITFNDPTWEIHMIEIHITATRYCATLYIRRICTVPGCT